MDKTALFRVVDANINRLKEGVRVVEDIERFVFNNSETSSKLKKIRHSATLKNQSQYLKFRNSKNDVLKKSMKIENKREEIFDIEMANLKRAEESARVLEEVFKVLDFSESEKFKNIRFELYNLEVEIFNKKG